MPNDAQIAALEARIAALEAKEQGAFVNLDTNIYGLFEVVSAVPSGVPRTIYEQIKIYTSGTTYRLYWYDRKNNAWHYVTATA